MHIQKTEHTPEVILNEEEGLMQFYGESCPENVKTFYDPVLDWLENYLQSPAGSTKVVFRLEYFDTSSSKIIYDILAQLKGLQEEGKDVLVEWHYQTEDEDMKDAGQKYDELLELNIQTVEFS